DLFDIWTHVHGGDTWTACKAIAEIAGVDISTPKTKHRSMPRRMTRDVLAQAVHELLEADHAQAARQFLAARGLYAPRALAELGIGFCRGYLVFAQFTESGDLLERYRGYLPGGNPPWLWLGSGQQRSGLWPAQRAPAAEDKILLLEGERDVLTALVRLRFHRQGW